MTSRIEFENVARPPISEQVAERIQRAILDRTLAPGERLPPERELAERFGVSRATVREALRRLQAQGLVSARGRTSPLEAGNPDVAVGHFRQMLSHVVQLRNISLRDLVELRFALESAAFVQAAKQRKPTRLTDARAALETMAMPNVSSAEFRAADVAFHMALTKASGNQAFELVMLAVRDAIHVHLKRALSDRDFERHRERLIEEHRALLHAVERGHTTSIANLLRTHFEFYAT